MLMKKFTYYKEKHRSYSSYFKEIGLEVNAAKTKYMVMSQDQNAGRSHNIKIDNSSFERVEQLKYLGTSLTHQYSIQEEIRSSLKSGNASYHLVQKLVCSSFLSKNIKIKIYRNISLSLVVYWYETWSFILREECRLSLLEKRV
jgi:hypothetical protein